MKCERLVKSPLLIRSLFKRSLRYPGYLVYLCVAHCNTWVCAVVVLVSNSSKAGQAGTGTAAGIQPFLWDLLQGIVRQRLSLGESGLVLYNLGIHHSLLSTLYTFLVTAVIQSCA